MRTSTNRLLATVFGAGYLLIGAAGFVATAGVGFFSAPGGLLFGLFGVNPFHNVAHLLIGGVLLLAGLRSERAAKIATTTIGTAYLLLGLLGLFIVGSALNVLAINGADNVLHFGSAALLLAVGLGADRRPEPA